MARRRKQYERRHKGEGVVSVSKARPKVWRGIGMKDKDQYGNEVLFVHFADNRPLPKWMDRGNEKNAVCLLDIVARPRRPRVKG